MTELLTLIKQIESIDELTKDTCEMCGGTYAENLDGVESYFRLNGVKFKISIVAI